MGVCMSTEEKARSRELDRLIQKDFNSDKKITKLLLLGTGESGKSTIVKQMKILHPSPEKDAGLAEDERMKQRKTISTNVLDSIQAILDAVDRFGIQLASEDTKRLVLEALMKREEEEIMLTPELGEQIRTLWADPNIKKVLEKRAELQILDSADYFLNNIERISATDYVPTEADVLRARSITTGIITVPFKVDGLKFELVDVGGQRSERKKWIHCFDQVTAVMFIIALSEYDQVLYEDESTNRMKESLNLFKQMLNSPFFYTTPFILFLNKEDIFQEKIQFSNITSAFEEYTGQQTADEAKAYIKKKFLSMNTNTKREVYSFYTTATDTDLVRNVFKSVQDIILNKILTQQGF